MGGHLVLATVVFVDEHYLIRRHGVLGSGEEEALRADRSHGGGVKKLLEQIPAAALKEVKEELPAEAEES